MLSALVVSLVLGAKRKQIVQLYRKYRPTWLSRTEERPVSA
ncbi:MAG: hypothetical protein WCV84_05590 [Patescibacteria group bacterium]